MVGCKKKVYLGPKKLKTMKNYSLLLLAMMTSLCALAKDYTLEEVRDQWTSREIKVANGGKNPNIVQLLTAFQNVWGT